MTANIRHRAELAVAAPNDQNRLVRDRGREKLTRFTHLIGAAGELPGPSEDIAILGLEYFRIEVVARWNRARERQT
jgi:hypothetical protein